MAIPDNRIRFPATRIDFTNDVGLTGQDHDNYPPPSGQARYDHLRMFLQGLLSCQSSAEAPTQFREGTLWFDTAALRIRHNSEWVLLADTIALTEPDSAGDQTTLSEWYTSVQDLLVGLSPEIVFSGSCTVDNVTTITIPESLRSQLASDSRVFLHLNGLLISPLKCSLIGTPPTTIRLSGISLSVDDTFVVCIRRVPATTYLGSSITVP